MTYLVETPGKIGRPLGPEVAARGREDQAPSAKFTINVPLAKAAAAGEKIELRVSLLAFVCSESSSLCQIKSTSGTCPSDSRLRRSRRGDRPEHTSRPASDDISVSLASKVEHESREA